MTITEFLTARLDEEERRAKAIHAEDCESIPREGYNGPFPCDCGVPAHLLAKIAGERAIIGWHSDNPHECEGPMGSEYVADEDSMPCSTMCALTLPYVDHADYNPEWKL